MTLRAAAVAALSLAIAPAFAAGHAGAIGYLLADDGASLVVMTDLTQPDSATTLTLAAPLRAIAYHPVTGALLGYANGAIYAIDPATGGLTDLAASFLADAVIPDGAFVGLDVDTAINAVRAVSTMGDNLVYFPSDFGDNDERAGSVRRFDQLAYLKDDNFETDQPEVFANAYTNAVPGIPATATVQYVLDAATNALATLANDDGTLESIGPVTIDGAWVNLLPSGGFDIVSPAEGEDRAFAVLHLDGQATAGLYTLDLTTGAATLITDLGRGGIIGLAVAPAM